MSVMLMNSRCPFCYVSRVSELNLQVWFPQLDPYVVHYQFFIIMSYVLRQIRHIKKLLLYLIGRPASAL
jgi:hypothetical protein